ncbi:hypothetical protein HOH87_04080 [bacterium]|jgi:hypothetical protein|nr:hypothetical protein [bacterium]
MTTQLKKVISVAMMSGVDMGSNKRMKIGEDDQVSKLESLEAHIRNHPTYSVEFTDPFCNGDKGNCDKLADQFVELLYPKYEDELIGGYVATGFSNREEAESKGVFYVFDRLQNPKIPVFILSITPPNDAEKLDGFIELVKNIMSDYGLTCLHL